ncbi:exported protein of unknown function [Nitrosotalea devaniterrae]|uniref:Uncharacterized protein n=1 Tax=Nitrosotalea devaniterrae TaxID=1078905 RepID=A0A128A106_9ARCH|nr:exported protein of unknown function [Candidatus Nitrosotalea devanaterra]
MNIKKAIEAAIAAIGVAIVAVVGIIVMGQMCPIAYQNTANNPSAFHSATQLCTMFFQNAPQWVNHLT